MVDQIAELARPRRDRLYRTLQHLEDDELVAWVERSNEDAQRTIEEWQDFVEGLDRAMRAMRAMRNVSPHRGRPARTTRLSA